MRRGCIGVARAAAAALALVWSTAGTAQTTSGETLVTECAARTPVCDAFISASVETHWIREQYLVTIAGQRLVCMPDGLTVSEARTLVLDYVRRRPADRRWSAGVLVMAALEEAFVCTR